MGPGHAGPLFPRNGWGDGSRPPSPREAAPPNPRWEIPVAAAGSGRERGRAAGPAAPRGSGDKAPAAAFVPFSDGVSITSGPAAIWAEAARSARGPRPSLASRLAPDRGRPPSPSLRGPKFAASNLSLHLRGEWNEWFLKNNWRPFWLLPKPSPIPPPDTPHLD